MKKMGLVIVSLFMIISIQAQKNNTNTGNDKRTLLSNNKLTGGFVGTNVKTGDLNNQGSLWVGGEVGLIFGDDFHFGFVGYGLASTVKSNNRSFDDKSLYYQSGYGGFLLEPALFENRVLNLSFPLVLGAGGIAETKFAGIVSETFEFQDEEFEIYDEDYDFYNTDFFWVVEPGAALNLNLTRWMKLSAGVSYRMAYGLDLPHTDNESMNGLNGNVSLKLGWF